MSQVCRTCLKQVTPTDFVSIDDSNEDPSLGVLGVRQELGMCIPELDLDLVANAVVCLACVNELHATFRFKKKCLQTEEKIQFCVQSAAMDISQIELRNLMNLINNSDNLNFVAFDDAVKVGSIKQEPVFLPTHEETSDHNFVKEEPTLGRLEVTEDSFEATNCQNGENSSSSVCQTMDMNKKSLELYTCSVCNEMFNTSRTLHAHEKTHTSERLFRCTRCDYSTSENRDLIQHVQTHTKELPITVNSTTNKRKTFTIEDKVDLIRKLEGGKKISEVCRETGLATSTVCCIWKSKDTILSAFEKNGPHLKRLRKPIHADVDEALFIWFKEQGSDIPVTGPLLKGKAIELARAMGKYDFVCSGSWLDRFKARYNICFGKKRC